MLHLKVTVVSFTAMIAQCASRPLSEINFPVRNSKIVLSLKLVGRGIFERTEFANFKVSIQNKNKGLLHHCSILFFFKVVLNN